ncbi:hypothetical protein BST81_21220 [Leptolyngbya sp. 'hensonii']|nr:hypothetical protein BST81_21220 [Leptolyngbya sp. 'hensonii']
MNDPVQKVLFIGSKKLGLRVLQEMITLSPSTLVGIMTIEDKDDTRTVFRDFQALAEVAHLPFYVAQNRKHSEGIIDMLKPELCIVVGWYWLISQECLGSVPRGFIGIHNSLLPRYRGGAPLIWALINGEKQVGFSLFSFSVGMDDGPIWTQGHVTVDETDYINDVLEKLEARILEVMREKYPAIINNEIVPIEQQHSLATYCAQRFPTDGNINWFQSARFIYNFIRAQSAPYPGAFTIYEGKILKIWRAKLFHYDYYGIPGQVARIDQDGVYVICGNNRAIVLQEVELLGQRDKAQNFIKSIKTRFSCCWDEGFQPNEA